MYSRFISAVSAARQPSLIREMTQVTLKSDQVTQVQLKSFPSDPCICSARNDPPVRRLPKPSDVPLQAAHPRSLRGRSDCPAREGAAGDLYLPKLVPDIFPKLLLLQKLILAIGKPQAALQYLPTPGHPRLLQQLRQLQEEAHTPDKVTGDN